jgi:hypothetical protein
MRIEVSLPQGRPPEFNMMDIPSPMFLLIIAGLKLLSLSKKWADRSRYDALLQASELEKVYNATQSNLS